MAPTGFVYDSIASQSWINHKIQSKSATRVKPLFPKFDDPLIFSLVTCLGLPVTESIVTIGLRGYSIRSTLRLLLAL